MLIWALTVGIQLIFSYGTCDVSTLVGMTRHNIYVFQVLDCKQLQGVFLKVAFYY